MANTETLATSYNAAVEQARRQFPESDVNPELLAQPCAMFKGNRVKLFLSTSVGDSCTGAIVGGKDDSKWTTVYFADATPIPVEVIECPTCQKSKPLDGTPNHFASSACESGKRAHCTCDTCY